MSALCALWLPILLSTVAVYLVSSIIHMATPGTRAITGCCGSGILPGRAPALRPDARDYMAPVRQAWRHAQPRVQAPASVGTGAVLYRATFRCDEDRPAVVQWVLYSLVISLFAAYIAVTTLPAGSAYCGYSNRRYERLPRLRRCAGAAVDLVRTLVVDDDTHDARWLALCAADRRPVRLALAALIR